MNPYVEDDLPIQPEWNVTRNQLLMWLAQRLRPSAPLFNEIVTVTLVGPLDPERFERAFDYVIAESDALRSIFIDPHGWPERREHEARRAILDHVDLSAAPMSRQAYADWLGERCGQVLDLETCLVDSALIRLADDEFVWFWNQHQLVADGWSISVLYKDLCEYYRQMDGASSRSTPLAVRFADFVRYEATLRTMARYARARVYWHRKSQRVVGSLFHQRNEVTASTAVVRISRQLTRVADERLYATARLDGVFALSEVFSRSALLIAAMVIYLYRIRRSPYVVVGSAFRNRPARAFERTIGSFAHFLPLGIELRPADTVRALIAKLEIEMMEAIQHQSYAPRNPVGRPMYEVFVNTVLVDDVCRHVSGDDGVATAAWHTSGHAPSALGVSAFTVSADVPTTLVFDFNASVFDPGSRVALITDYISLLDRLGDDLDVALLDL